LITQTGTINSADFGQSALLIENSHGVATITNDGLIKGNTQLGGFLDGFAQYGISVYSQAKITNNGVIRGGAGYPTSET
jgi:hypothetical protein